MKRITCIITAFLTFLLISINSLSVYALPNQFPPMHWSNKPTSMTNSQYIFGHILFYRSSTNDYITFVFTVPIEYIDFDYLELSYNEESGYYFLGSQSHLSSNSTIWRSNGTIDSSGSCYFSFLSGNTLTNTNIETITNQLNYSIKFGDNNGLLEIVASSVNITYNNSIIFQGSEEYYFSLHATSTKQPYPTERIEKIEPTEPPTEAPTIAEGGDSGDDVETSKNILDNVKQILTNIANLPKNIANAIHNFFSDLLSGIITGLNNLKDGIIQGLKDLFIPSDNAFTDIVDMVKTKFTFVYNFLDIAKTILVFSFDDDVEPPNFKMEDKSGKWFNTPLSIIDWTIYEPYRAYVHALILAICWYQFIERTIKRLPSIIGGI